VTAGRSKTRVPIALPTVHIQVDSDGALAVTLDKEPYAVPPGFHRDRVRQFLHELAGKLGPIRVEITESNGERYVDIATPYDDGPKPAGQQPAQSKTPETVALFRAGEEVMIAVSVARRTADPDGNVAFRLPPSFVQRYGDALVLVGQTSQVSATFNDLYQGELA